MDLHTTNENNETVVWIIEGGTPARLKRQGWKRDSIKVGDHVKIVGNPNRDPEIKHLYLDHIVLENGTTLSLSSTIRRIETSEIDTTTDRKHPPRREMNIHATDPTVTPSIDFSGTWSRGPKTYLTSNFFEPPIDWPLTERGEAQLARFDEHDNPAYDCLDRGLPFFSVMPYWLAWTRYEDRIEIEL